MKIAPLEDRLDDRVDAAQLLEHARVGRVARLRLAALRQADLHEQDLAQLLGAADRELVAHGVVDLALEAGDLRGELHLERPQRVAIEGDARGLHPGEDRDQRQLDLGEDPLDPVRLERLLERGSDRERGEGVEPCDRRGREACGGRRQHEVEALRDDVRDLLGAQRRVDEVRGDLGVERDDERGRVAVLGEVRGEDRLDLVADERGVDRLEQVAQGDRRVRAIGRDDSSVLPGDGERERGPGERPRVVHDQPDADRRLGAQPRLEGGHAVRAHDLDPRRVVDRRRERGRQVARHHGDVVRSRLGGCGPAIAVRRHGHGRRRRRRLPAADPVEVERQLELARRAVRRPAVPATAAAGVRATRPLARPTADALRRREARLAQLAHRGDRVLGTLARERRQPVDERPELVLAEQPHDGLAVVLPHPPALEIQLDVAGAHEPHQLA